MAEDDYTVYDAPALSLSADTWDIPVGQSAAVTFTVTCDEEADVPTLYCGEEKVADFQPGMTGYTAVLSLESYRRDSQTYYAACGAERSNTVKISFLQEETAAEDQQVRAFLDRVRQAYLEVAPAENPSEEELTTAAEATVAVLDDGMEQGIVADYSPELTGFTVTFQNGITRVLELFSYEDQWSTPDDCQKLAETMENYLEGGVTGTAGREILLLQPYYFEDSCSDMEQACRYIVDKYDNFTLHIVRNVTVDLMKNLDDYDIVLFEGHGGYSTEQSSPFITFPVDHYERDGTVLYNAEHTKAFIYANFFERYYHAGDFDGMMFYMGSCYSSMTDTFSNVFMKKGAEAYIGFTSSVSINYSHRFAKELFKNLTINRMGVSMFMAKCVVGSYDNSVVNYFNWIGTIERDSAFSLSIGDHKDYFARAVCVMKGDYAVPTDGRTYKLPGVVFASNYTWRIISEYDWDSCNTHEVFIEDRSWYDWTANCSTEATDYIFYFEGDEGDPYALPLGVMVTNQKTRSGVGPEYITGLRSGMTLEQVEPWLEGINRAISGTPVGVYTTQSDDPANITYIIEDAGTGGTVYLRLMFDQSGVLYGVLFAKVQI